MQKKSKFNLIAFMMLIILGLTFQPAIPTYAACPDGISSYWKLDELTLIPGDSDGIYEDSFYGNDGEGNVNPTAVPAPDGAVKGAQQFDGANTGIDVEADSSFSWFQGQSFSIEFWIKRNGGTGAGGSNEIAIGRDDGDPLTSLHWWVGIDGDDANTAQFVLGDNDGGNISVSGTKVITNNEWHHVVAVRDGESGQNLLYVDGALDGSNLSATYSSGFDSTTAKLNIGYLNYLTFFRLNGFLDEVALYNRRLTVDEIVAHYNNGLPEDDYCSGGAPFVPFPDDTISLWKLDELTLIPGDSDGIYEDSFDGNHGEGNVNPTAVPAPDGTVKGAQQFDGANTGIDVEADSSFSWFQDQSFSIEFWIKRDGGTGAGGSNEIAIGRDDGDPLTSLHWWVGIDGDDANTAQFVLGDNDGGNISVSGTKVITNNEWHHVVAVRDGESGQNLLYVDGALDGSNLSASYSSGFDSTTAKLNIGYLNYLTFFRLNGFLDEVALYSRALTTDEITEHYNSGNDDGEGIADSRPAPVAAADATPTNPQEATVVTLDGTGSAAGYAAAPITTYLWEQTDGTDVGTITNSGTITATFTAPDFDAAGNPLTFQLTVTASDGQSNTTTVDVNVVDNPPNADAGPLQNVTEGAPVALDGSDSTGTGITYAWTQPVGTQVTLTGADTATPSFTAPDVAAGGETLTFQLTVTDNLGATSTDTVDVNVADASGPLQANAGGDQTVAPGAQVTLDGTASTGTGLTYAWIQGPVGTRVMLLGADTAQPTFTAPDASAVTATLLETLTFELTVTDNAGLTSSATTNVNVDDGVAASSGGGGGGGGGCFINSMF